jgi:hypothetical protein
MSDKRSIINVNLEPVASVIMVAVLAIGFGAFFLVRGLADESPAAFAIVGGMATLALFLLGTIWLLVVQGIGRKHERNREAATQESFILNAKENLLIMQQTARAQGIQNATLLKQQAAQQRLLPPGGNTTDGELSFDESVFADMELDGEL